MYVRNVENHSSSATESHPRWFGSPDECLFVSLKMNGSSRHVTPSWASNYPSAVLWTTPVFHHNEDECSLISPIHSEEQCCTRHSAGDTKSSKISLWMKCSRPEIWSCLIMLPVKAVILKTYFPDTCSILFCTMTNKCIIILQIITLLHVWTISCHPLVACNQYLVYNDHYFTNYHTSTYLDTVVSSSGGF